MKFGKLMFLIITTLLGSVTMSAQSTSGNMATGFPENGVFEGSAFDSVQMNNGNLHIQIPFVTLPGRHHDYHYVYSYDNRGWGFLTHDRGDGYLIQSVKPEPFNGMQFRPPDPVEGYNVNFTISFNVKCGEDDTMEPPVIFYGNVYSNHIVIEKNGTKHGFFPIENTPFGPNCPIKQLQPFRAYATDGSGWVMDIGSDGKIVRTIKKDGDQNGIDTNGNIPAAEIPAPPSTPFCRIEISIGCSINMRATNDLECKRQGV
jgi:hypothetical protein